MRGTLTKTQDSFLSACNGGVSGAQTDGKGISRFPLWEYSLYYVTLMCRLLLLILITYTDPTLTLKLYICWTCLHVKCVTLLLVSF